MIWRDGNGVQLRSAMLYATPILHAIFPLVVQYTMAFWEVGNSQCFIHALHNTLSVHLLASFLVHARCRLVGVGLLGLGMRL